MKPPKPRIQKRRLTWKWERNAWRPYHLTSWKEAGKRRQKAILLAGDSDAEKPDRLYWQCEAGRHQRQEAPAKFTWQALIVAWRSDPRIQTKTADSTKRQCCRHMNAIMEKNGGKDMRRTTRQGVRAIHEALAGTPNKADKRITIISLLWNCGRHNLDWPLGDNPAANIEKFGAQTPYEPWPEWMVSKLDGAPVNVRTAAELILGSGQRPSAAINMRWDDFDGEWMTVFNQKAGARLTVYCPEDLRLYLSTLTKIGEHILAKNLTQVVGYDAIEKPFRAWRANLGLEAKPFTLHALRKLAIIRLAEAGASDAEIQAVTDQSPQTVAYCRRKASRLKLSRAAQERRQKR